MTLVKLVMLVTLVMQITLVTLVTLVKLVNTGWDQPTNAVILLIPRTTEEIGKD